MMSNHADKRTVSTDALETLGTIHTRDEHRDAIHLGVEPAVAAEPLYPGQHIGLLEDGSASTKAVKKIGIVDPFIADYVDRGERFWLVVYPRQITSLRHVWTHPDFPDTPDLPDIKAEDKERARQWLEQAASAIDEDLESILDAADQFAKHGEYWNKGEKFEGNYLPDEFWDHWRQYTGRPIPPDAKRWGGNFLTCSC